MLFVRGRTFSLKSRGYIIELNLTFQVIRSYLSRRKLPHDDWTAIWGWIENPVILRSLKAYERLLKSAEQWFPSGSCTVWRLLRMLNGTLPGHSRNKENRSSNVIPNDDSKPLVLDNWIYGKYQNVSSGLMVAEGWLSRDSVIDAVMIPAIDKPTVPTIYTVTTSLLPLPVVLVWADL